MRFERTLRERKGSSSNKVRAVEITVKEEEEIVVDTMGTVAVVAAVAAVGMIEVAAGVVVAGLILTSRIEETIEDMILEALHPSLLDLSRRLPL